MNVDESRPASLPRNGSEQLVGPVTFLEEGGIIGWAGPVVIRTSPVKYELTCRVTVVTITKF